MKLIFCSVLCAFTSIVALGKVVVVELILTDAETNVVMSLSTGGSDSQSVEYSGNLRARIYYNEITLRPEFVRFVDGKISASDTAFEINSDISFTGLGTFNTTIFLATKGLSVSPMHPSGDNRIDEQGNILEIEESKIVGNEGSVTQSITLLGETVSEVRDFSADPIVTEFSEWAKLQIEEISSTDVTQTLQFTLTYNGGGESVEPLEGTNASLRTVETGTITCIGEMEVLTDYGEWLQDKGLDPENPPAIGTGGLPIRLLYAFDLPLESTRWPTIMYVYEGFPYLVLKLPPRGLKATLVPEVSHSLEVGSWLEMPSENILTGVESLRYGAMNHLSVVRLANRGSQFLRFRVEFE